MSKPPFLRGLTIVHIAFFVLAVFLFLNFLPIKKIDTDNQEKLRACLELDISGSKIECQEKVVDEILSTEGTNVALRATATLFKEDPDFEPACHDFAHKIGEFTYGLYADGKDFDINPEITLCNYGFYHGFMETMIQEQGDYAGARKFCDFINIQMEQYGLSLIGECYHGIGHGNVDQHDSEQWSNPATAVSESIELCRKVANDERQLIDCSSGVFNGVANFYSAGQYGLVINKDDPFWLCREQDEIVQNVCYSFMARNLLSLAGFNQAQAIKLALETTPPNYLEAVITNITVIPSNISTQEIVNICRILKQKSSLACLRGHAISLLQTGQPGQEYLDPINFCGSELLNKTEKDVCYENILPQLKNYHPKDQLKRICNNIEDSYQYLCR